MKVQYAKIENHICQLNDEACFLTVVKHYSTFLCNSDIESLKEKLDKLIPSYVKGPKKGQRKGTANIRVCKEGGWYRLGQGERNGKVLYPGSIVGVWAGIASPWENKTFFSAGLVQ